VRFVSQNILHGIACPADSDACDVDARVELFVRQLADAGCPEAVGLQEVNQRIADLLEAASARVCDGRYRLVHDDDPGLDREVVLTTLKVAGSRRERLAGPLRTALFVRLVSDMGIVDFVTTHLASSSDDRPCDAKTCPPPCEASDMLNTCQARQVLALAERLATPTSVVVIGGDLNAKPDEPTIAAFRAAGYRDTHVVAGNAECDAQTGAQCTSGRVDENLTDLSDPSSRQSERIDYLWIGGSRQCDVIAPTGLFNAEPAAGAPGGLAYPSDHTGVQAAIRCATTPDQRDAAAGVTLPTVSTTTLPASGGVDAATKAAVISAFETLFSGEVADVNAKLAVLEDADRLRSHFLESYEATKAIASRIRVRIDSMSPVDATHVSVVYSLLLDDAAVLDHLPGEAVKQGDRWLVSRRTYCDVSTQGAEVIPEPCRN
jgi:endonuclease/exonuclease/phosphatase family metal-dependent hydrolase